MSKSITFGSSLHADSKYVIGFDLGCREVTLKSHFSFLRIRKKSPPAGFGIAHFFQRQSRILAKTPISAAEEKEIVEKGRRYCVFFTMRRKVNSLRQKRFLDLCMNGCIHSKYMGIIGMRKLSTSLLSY